MFHRFNVCFRQQFSWHGDHLTVERSVSLPFVPQPSMSFFFRDFSFGRATGTPQEVSWDDEENRFHVYCVTHCNTKKELLENIDSCIDEGWTLLPTSRLRYEEMLSVEQIQFREVK